MKAAFTGLVFSVAALLSLGLVMLYSSSMTQVGAQYLVRQLAWCGLGLICCALAACLDYELLRKFAWPIYLLAVGLLVLVLIAPPEYAPVIHSVRRWLVYHGQRVQPSEFAKLALIIALAWYGTRYQAHMHKPLRGIVIPLLCIGVVVGLVFREPDRGTTALLAAVSGAMLVMAGARLRYLLPPLGVAAVAFALYLWHDPMAFKRLGAWWDPDAHKAGVGYQAYEAKIALGSGGLTGLGLGNGRQKLGFVPEHHTDFIYSIVGEELGLVGTLAVVLTFVVLVVCGLHIARNARDTFGTLLAFGITILIGLQAVINIGVVTSALPNKGLPLPFISYGGSNLLMMLTCVGVLLSVARRATVAESLPQPQTDSEEIARPQFT